MRDRSGVDRTDANAQMQTLESELPNRMHWSSESNRRELMDLAATARAMLCHSVLIVEDQDLIALMSEDAVLALGYDIAGIAASRAN